MGSNPAEPTFFAKKNVLEKHVLRQGKDKKNPGRKKRLVPIGNGPDHLPSRCYCRRVFKRQAPNVSKRSSFSLRVTEWSLTMASGNGVEKIKCLDYRRLR